MKIVELLAIPIGFALVRSITKSIDDEPAAKPIVPVTPKGLTVGPAGGTGFNIFPQGVPTGLNITPAQLAAFTPERKVTIPTFDPTLPIAKPIKEGKIKKFGTGVNLADLFARQTPRK